MLPILISFGPIVIRTFNVVLIITLLLSGFVFWRKGREEHYEEDQLFDGFLITLIAGGIAARIGFVITHWSTLGWNVLQWVDLFSHPGFNALAGLIGSTVVLYRFATKQRWDAFEILDFWVLTMALALGLSNIGAFFEGTGYGYATNLPWGIIFPGVFEKHHPTQLYASALYLLLFIVLSKLEYSYRTFEWYKAKRKSAQTGFLFCVFVSSYGVVNLILSWLKPAEVMMSGISGDKIVAAFLVLSGAVLLYVRSGRSFHFANKKSVDIEQI